MGSASNKLQPSPPWLLLCVVSGAGIAYEILLIRWFSIVQWHHFAFLVVSLALLGHGLSGTLITLWIKQLLRHFPQIISAATVAFSLSSLICIWAAQWLEFNTLEILWDPWQWLRLCGVYLCLLIPFFFAAVVIVLTLRRFTDQIAALYAVDLSGAGVGAIIVTLGLYRFKPGELVLLLAMSLLFVLIFTQWRWRRLIPKRSMGITLALLVLLPFTGKYFTPLHLSPYKPLSKALHLPQTKVVTERSSPFGWLSVLESPVVPLRITPGLSLHNPHPIPKQRALFIDGEGPFAINQYTSDKNSWKYLSQSPDAIGYRLQASGSPRKVLLLGLTGNASLLQAVQLGAESIDIVEPNTQLFQLSGLPKADKNNNVLLPQYYRATARGFLQQSINNPDNAYDLIKLPTLDSHSHALQPHYLLTREAFTLYWRHLSPQGVLVTNLALQLPPRTTPKLLNTIQEALKQLGITHPSNHLLILRSWNRATLLISKAPLTPAQIQTTKTFSRQLGFDLVHYPGIVVTEANYFNRLSRPQFFQATVALLGPNRENFIANYPFDIRISTDDRPYFFRFIRWQALPELFAARDSGGLTLIGRGYPVLIIGLVMALFFATLLILAPLGKLHHHQGPSQSLRHTMAYFGGIGLAFLMVEIVLLQWLVLFLSTPTLSAAVAMGAMLVFAGLGSLCSDKLQNHFPRTLRLVPVAIAIVGLSYTFVLPWVFDALAHWTLFARILISVLLIAPLAWLMGMPMPLGLLELAKKGPDQIPWAWGINGCTSVISAVLTTLLAVHFGFTLVFIAAFSIYGLVGLLPQRQIY